MDNSACEVCRFDWGDHRVRFNISGFVLDCMVDVRPRRLGPSFDVAQGQLADIVGVQTALALLGEFGEPTIEQRLFRVDDVTHQPGDSCSVCVLGWPVKCRDHGGCDGYLHVSLRHIRKDRRYDGKSTFNSELLQEVCNAWWNQTNVYARRPLRTRYVARVTCDHCGSWPSKSEVRSAEDAALGL